MSTEVQKIVDDIATSATMIPSLSEAPNEVALDYVAKEYVGQSLAIREGRGLVIGGLNDQERDTCALAEAVARDILDGQAERPGVGNVRASALAAMDHANELVRLSEAFTGRDSRGYVVGFYNYTPQGDRASGPHVTSDEAQAAQRGLGLGPYNILCGPIFTSKGTIFRTT